MQRRSAPDSFAKTESFFKERLKDWGAALWTLQEAGTVLHLARSGRLILRSKIPTIREGAVLVDEKGRKSCKVMEIIGPVSDPYISAQPLTDRIERITGTKLYLSDVPAQSGNRTAGSRPRPSGPRRFDTRRKR